MYKHNLEIYFCIMKIYDSQINFSSFTKSFIFIFYIYRNMYTIVEFVDEQLIETVPGLWVREDKSLCFWPNMKGSALRKAIESKLPPKSDWHRIENIIVIKKIIGIHQLLRTFLFLMLKFSSLITLCSVQL